ncbi:MAG: hypothetical protein JW818_11295 [Pirellulales bacterium]|nr:hypothetical protein [Pirellulales bacterium]
MEANACLGVLLATAAGFAVGGAAWPVKRMKAFRYEHWGFLAMFVGLILTPWVVVLCFCPGPFDAFRSVGGGVLLKSNLFSLCWGVANILFLICFERIGMSLTTGIVTGLGLSVGVTMPMVFKGTGPFEKAPDLGSPAGMTMLAAVGIMLLGVVLTSLAGMGREKGISSQDDRRGRYATSLLMVVVAGVLSAGIGLSFVYSQGPIIAAMKERGADDISANVAVWAAGLMAGATLNVLYPAWLMCRNRSWHVLVRHPREIPLALIFGLTFFSGFALMGKGMVLLGPLGASVGLGVQQATQILGGQAVGFFGGEWRGVRGKPLFQICLAIVALVVAVAVMALANTITE